VAYVFNPFTGTFDVVSDAASSPAGSTGQIQFNNAGAFGASSNLNWDATYNNLNVGTTGIGNSDLKIQLNAPTSGEANYSVNKGGGYGFLLGFRNGGSFNSITSPGYMRMVTTDPFAIVMNNSNPATVWNSSGDVAIGGNITTTAGAGATMLVLGSGRVGFGTQSPAARGHFIPESTTTAGLVVGSVALQTADIQEWRDSSNVKMASILATGEFRGRLSTVLSSNVIGHVIQASASQTANLTEWRNSSGTILTRVSNVGAIVTTPGIISGGSFTGGSGAAASSVIVIGQRWQLASSGTAGDLTLLNNSGTNPVKIQLGGTTAAAPSIENIGADLIIRSANATNATRVGIGAASPAAMLDVTALSDATITAIFRSASVSAVNVTEWRDSANSTRMRINQNFVFFPVQATTAAAPAYVLGGMYFDTTLNKLRIGGATAWETVTST